jgi:hypothetical protein
MDELLVRQGRFSSVVFHLPRRILRLGLLQHRTYTNRYHRSQLWQDLVLPESPRQYRSTRQVVHIGVDYFLTKNTSFTIMCLFNNGFEGKETSLDIWVSLTLELCRFSIFLLSIMLVYLNMSLLNDGFEVYETSLDIWVSLL